MKTRRGFTLVEMIISITLFTLVLVLGFDAMVNIGVVRTKVSSRLDLNRDLYAAVEDLARRIKDGGTIDYEEYWNRRGIGTATQSGHYRDPSGFGNWGSGSTVWVASYGSGITLCIGSGGTPAGTGGCLISGPQRYGQYTYEFWDYNSDANNDTAICTAKGIPNMPIGDQNCDGDPEGDDDDDDLGRGPPAFTGGTAMPELYLVRLGDRAERTFFRYSAKLDPNAPFGAICDAAGTASGCLGNIEMLKLTGRDYGLGHSGVVFSTGQTDGKVDTWFCQSDYVCTGPEDLATGTGAEWVPIFPDSINVKNVSFYVAPEKPAKLAWKERSDDYMVQPYVRFGMTIGFSWGKRKEFKTSNPEVTVTSTITLNP